MVPFAQMTTFHLGSMAIDAFSSLVAIAVIVGVVVARRRCANVALDPKFGERYACFATVVGLVTSHVVDVVAYHPAWIRDDPFVLLRVWGSHSSIAGMIGGVLGVALYAPRSRRLTLRDRLAYVDAFTYGFPFAWIFGRLGCTLVLDHPGRVTAFPLATSLASPEARAFLRSVYDAAGRSAELPSDAALANMGFHNLGFYEFVYTLLVLVPATVLLGRKPRAPGFGLAAFFLLYAPVRFAADFLRVGDETYAGLTFGQYAAIGLTIASAWVVSRAATNSGV